MNESDDDLLMCNCAKCGIELLGLGNRLSLALIERVAKGYLPPFVADRILDRPYCESCLGELTLTFK